MVLYPTRSMSGVFHGHGERRVEATTGDCTSMSLSGDKVGACGKLNGPGKALPSGLIQIVGRSQLHYL